MKTKAFIYGGHKSKFLVDVCNFDKHKIIEISNGDLVEFIKSKETASDIRSYIVAVTYAETGTRDFIKFPYDDITSNPICLRERDIKDIYGSIDLNTDFDNVYLNASLLEDYQHTASIKATTKYVVDQWLHDTILKETD